MHVDRFEQKVKRGMFALEAKLDRAIEQTREICSNVPKLAPIQDPNEVQKLIDNSLLEYVDS